MNGRIPPGSPGPSRISARSGRSIMDRGLSAVATVVWGARVVWHILVLVLLFPVLVVQIRRVIGQMPRLRPAAGASEGTTPGTDNSGGRIVRLLVVGESTAVGVGAPTHAEALPGHLAAAVRNRAGHGVAWWVCGQVGATAHRVTSTLVPALGVADVDLVVVTIGINDLVRARRSMRRWASDLAELITALHNRYQRATVVIAGMPPLHRFPALPQPLRYWLGARAELVDWITRRVATAHGAVHVPMDAAMASDRRLFAADGFHPSPEGYHLWAEALAQAAVSQMAMSRAEQLAPSVSAADTGIAAEQSGGSFRAAVEAGNIDAIAALLHPEVVFHSPVMVKPYQGREQVTALIRVLAEVLEDFRYVTDLIEVAPFYPARRESDERAQALEFHARVKGKAVHGLDLIHFDKSGLVTSLTVMVRPLPAAMTLARAVGHRYADHAPPAA